MERKRRKKNKVDLFIWDVLRDRSANIDGEISNDGSRKKETTKPGKKHKRERRHREADDKKEN